jgi:hypothetical protein
MNSVLKVVAVNIGVLLAGLVVCELIFGNWIFGPDYRELNLPRNTVRVFDVEGLYAGGGTITYSRDAHGFREPYDDILDIDVLTLGGSTTNQLYVDDDKTWHAVMRNAFKAAGKDVSIVNAGVDGQSSRGHIAVFERWFPLIEGLKARYILAYVGINDVALEYADQYDDMRSPDPVRRLAAWAKNKSAVYDLYKTIKGMLAARDAHVVHASEPRRGLTWEKWRRRDLDSNVSDQYRVPLAAYEKRLHRLAAAIEAFGSKPVFVTQPSADYRIQGDWYLLPTGPQQSAIQSRFLQLDAFNRLTMQVCLELDAICIDLANELVFEDDDFYDRIHNTDSGTEKIGRYLFRAMQPYL